jgi:hypothetical protein
MKEEPTPTTLVFLAIPVLALYLVTPAEAGDGASRCGKFITSENARAVFNVVSSFSGKECKLLGVKAVSDKITIEFEHSDGNRIGIAAWPFGCEPDRKVIIGKQFSFEDSPLFREMCADIASAFYDDLRHEFMGQLGEPQVSVGHHSGFQDIDESGSWFLTSRQRLFLQFVLLLCIVVVLTRSFSTWRTVYAGDVNRSGSAFLNLLRDNLLSFETVYLSFLLAGTFMLIVSVVPGYLANATLTYMDLSWIFGGEVVSDISFFTGFRLLAMYETALVYHFVGLDPERWFLAILLVHFIVSGTLVFAFSRTFGLNNVWATCAALLFVSNPAVLEAFYTEYLLEVMLLPAYLLVCIAFINRRKASSFTSRSLWFSVEIIAVVLGSSNKESFVVYIGLLGSIELLYLWPTMEAPVPKKILQSLRAMAPSLVLLGCVCTLVVPWIFNTGVHEFSISMHPAHLVHQFGLLLGKVALPAVGNSVTVGLSIGSAVAIYFYRRHKFKGLYGLSLLLLVITIFPMLPLVDRAFPGYLYVPWAALSLSLIVMASSCKSILARIGLLMLLLFSFMGQPEMLRNDNISIDGATVQKLGREISQKCGSGVSVVRLEEKEWSEYLQAINKGEVGIEEGKQSVALVEMLVKVICKNRDAGLEIVE